ncbi:MAG: SDR family oxidoreductase [Alphaproteobacteria bacterium]|nr:MAG: SDR family oxidoreductase [Alphaproteobacteria bacterium]
MMKVDLEGRTILVTGASRGIGAAIAETLLECGAHVALHWHSEPAACDRLVARFGARACSLRADLGEQAQVRRLWQEVCGWRGRLDGLVNNAAVMPYSAPEGPQTDWARDWDACWRVNIRAVADLSRLAILHFKERGGGRLVNIASRAAFRGDLPDAMHYAASKGAVVALTRSIAKGYAKQGVRAFIIAPGWTRTERVLPRIEAAENAHMLAEIPIGGAVPPREIGNLAAFLLAGLADHATGGTFDINGASYFH